MKKRLYILFLSLFSVSGVTSAQEVFNKVMESAQHILNEPTSTFTNTQIAKFKVDELNYMKGKAMEKDSVAAIDLLDVQSYYMSEFLSMFYTEIITLQTSQPKTVKPKYFFSYKPHAPARYSMIRIRKR